MFRTILGSDQANSAKITEINNESFGLIEMWSCLVLFGTLGVIFIDQTWNPKTNATLVRIQLFHHQSARVSHLYWAFIPWFTLSINQFLNNTYYLFWKLNWSDRDMQPKLHIPSTINTWRKLFNKSILERWKKNWLLANYL